MLGTNLLLPSSGQVRIWSSQDASCSHTLDGPSSGIEWLSWHPRGDVLVAGSEDFTAWMWNASSGAVMQVLPAPHGRCADACMLRHATAAHGPRRYTQDTAALSGADSSHQTGSTSLLEAARGMKA